MSLEEFLNNLQFDIERANQPNWEPDWDDAPLPYKLYRGLPVVPLSSEVPLTLEENEHPVKPDLERIGHFLWYVFGISQVSQQVFPDEEADPYQSFRRFAPSGGALYPNELYMYLKIDGLKDGIYHYNPAHHRLVLLREGNFDSYISRALGDRCDVATCFGTAFVSTRFWKNFFKYNNFSYRLQGLDAGVMVGQMLETSKRFGYATGVYHQFLDSAVNHLLGMDEEESVYSVIPLTVEPTNWVSSRQEENLTSDELKREIQPIYSQKFERSKRVLEFPRLIEANQAAKLESVFSFQRCRDELDIEFKEAQFKLPEIEPASYDLVKASENRFSPEMDFIMGKVSQQQLAAILQDTMSSLFYRNDVNQHAPVSIYACLYNVEGIPNGAYYYDHAEHALREIRKGDQRLVLQSGLSMDNVNMMQVPICVHLVGNSDFYKKELGYRGYRILQVEAGILLQRMLLAASNVGLGSHPLLGFNANLADEIYGLKEKGKTSLIQVPIGPYRPRAWLKGSLRS
ncbi:SagB family peptide dehydrogenase [Mesobacillus subterraneus]|uniref:SagB/ThcOx family dehydrogenase n=1 Tax=Mesobacillus subterraneus TaxID=285983 RepID=A0A427TW54_9BACI|nr:SagB family peptide dehydrogenase [Mesobacillus subterraneus]RSD28693.1 SagB/ThcOx family dehydrogenase [Mesobacillus subterraneus]